MSEKEMVCVADRQVAITHHHICCKCGRVTPPSELHGRFITESGCSEDKDIEWTCDDCYHGIIKVKRDEVFDLLTDIDTKMQHLALVTMYAGIDGDAWFTPVDEGLRRLSEYLGVDWKEVTAEGYKRSKREAWCQDELRRMSKGYWDARDTESKAFDILVDVDSHVENLAMDVMEDKPKCEFRFTPIDENLKRLAELLDLDWDSISAKGHERMKEMRE